MCGPPYDLKKSYSLNEVMIRPIVEVRCFAGVSPSKIGHKIRSVKVYSQNNDQHLYKAIKLIDFNKTYV